MASEAAPWKDTERNNGITLHSLCSYMAMFPAALPRHFIEKYSSVGDVVFDPFSGRGTTVLEACLLGRIGVGNDRNPLAYLLTKAKVHVPSKGRLLKKISRLEEEYSNANVKPQAVEHKIRMLFHPQTLKQLYFLKKRLRWKTSATDAFLLATLTGIIHGDSSSYLSISMPNTFSMSPDYIKKYVKEHSLKRPVRNVFELLRRRIEYVHRKLPIKGRALKCDARRLKKIKTNSIPLIVTSPPYTNVIRYGQFNWIRLWLLDESGREVDKKLMVTESLQKYAEFMSSCLKEFNRVLVPGGKAVIVIGDVRNRRTEIVHNLAEYIWENSARPLGFQLAEPIIEDNIRDDTKVSKIWGAKKGKATKIDRIMVLEKPLAIPLAQP